MDVTRISNQCSHSVEVQVYKPLKMTINRWHCSSNEKNQLKRHSTVNNQNTEDDLKILLRMPSITTNITTLIHLRDQAVYVWTTLDTVQIRNPESCRVIRRFAF
jgi:hypothetical protein